MMLSALLSTLLPSLGLAGLAALVWSIRLEGRVNGHDTLFTERENHQKERDLDITNRLVRIERKLDQQSGQQ